MTDEKSPGVHLTPVDFDPFAETAVSDSTLERLRGLAHLGELYVGGTRVTEAGIDAFRRARPGCHVSTEAK